MEKIANNFGLLTFKKECENKMDKVLIKKANEKKQIKITITDADDYILKQFYYNFDDYDDLDLTDISEITEEEISKIANKEWDWIDYYSEWPSSNFYKDMEQYGYHIVLFDCDNNGETIFSGKIVYEL